MKLSAKTIERMYYAARDEADPVSALARKVPNARRQLHSPIDDNYISPSISFLTAPCSTTSPGRCRPGHPPASALGPPLTYVHRAPPQRQLHLPIHLLPDRSLFDNVAGVVVVRSPLGSGSSLPTSTVHGIPPQRQLHLPIHVLPDSSLFDNVAGVVVVRSPLGSGSSPPTSTVHRAPPQRQLHLPIHLLADSSLFADVAGGVVARSLTGFGPSSTAHRRPRRPRHPPSTTITSPHPPPCPPAPCSTASPVEMPSGHLAFWLLRSGGSARSSPGSPRGAPAGRSRPPWSWRP